MPTPLYPKSTQLKQEIRELERQGDDNLYGKFQRRRQTVTERNANLERHLSEQLQELPNISIQKFSKKEFKRGL